MTAPGIGGLSCDHEVHPALCISARDFGDETYEELAHVRADMPNAAKAAYAIDKMRSYRSVVGGA
jgi:hypothetical protein